MPFAVFLDVLGTSSAMSLLPDDHVFTRRISPSGTFQYCLDWAAKAADEALVFHASFSDCGYLVIDDPEMVLKAVNRAVSMFWNYSIPVRGGIGFGNFGLEGTASRWDGRSSRSEANFFGSAIVRAHRAESCGHKGMRVFVHSSAAELLRGAHAGVTVYEEDKRPRDEEWSSQECSATVVELLSSPYGDVGHEICFLGDDSVNIWFEMLETIRSRRKPDERAMVHYSESRAALLRFQALRS